MGDAEAVAVSLERAARLVREMPPSDRTLVVAEMLAVLTQRVIETSPSDQADLAAAVLARWMHS
jgi:hypothetical protein